MPEDEDYELGKQSPKFQLEESRHREIVELLGKILLELKDMNFRAKYGG